VAQHLVTRFLTPPLSSRTASPCVSAAAHE
jgi:hypothetical protein